MILGRQATAPHALLLLWGPTLAGAVAVLLLRNLYGVAVYFAAYVVTLSMAARLNAPGRRLMTLFAAVCAAVAVGLVVLQSQL